MEASTQTPCMTNDITFTSNYDTQFYTKQKSFVNHVSDYDFANIDKEEKSLSSCQSLSDVGYVFDEHGILRQIYNGQPFPFKGLLSPNCKSRYDQFRKLTAKYVRTKLMERGLLFPTVELGNNGPVMRVLHSRDFYTNRGTLLVLIQAGMVARAGVWCPRLLLYVSGGLYVASQIPYVDKALSSGYSVLIINSNEYLPPRSSNKLERSPSPEELINAAWQHILPTSPAQHIIILAHMYAGTALLQPLQPAPLKCPLNWGLTSTASNVTKFESISSWTLSMKNFSSGDNLYVDPALVRYNDTDILPANRELKGSGDSSSSAESLTNSCSQRGSANAGSHRVSPDIPNSSDSAMPVDESVPTSRKRSKNLNPATFQDSDQLQSSFRSDIAHFRHWESRRFKFWLGLKKRVRAIVFTDSVVNLKMQGIQDEDVLKWFEQNSIHYAASAENLNVRVDHSAFYRDIPTYSAGTQEHDRIPSCVMDCAFSFFERKIEEYKHSHKHKQTTSSSKSRTKSTKLNETTNDMKPGPSWM